MITIREATQEDAHLLWEWANEKKVRKNAYNQEEISWSSHIRWLKDKLNSGNCFLFIAKDDDTSIGQIRFDFKKDNKAIIDVSVSKSMRGKGYGSRIIELGSQYFLKLNPRTEVHAYIKKENIGSKKAFEKAGFNTKCIETIKGFKSYHLIK